MATESDALESAKKSRTAIRRSFTVTANKFEKRIESEPANTPEITALYQLLQNKSDSLSTYDATIFEYLTSSDTSEELLDRELEEVDNYKQKSYILQVRYLEMSNDEDKSQTNKTVQKSPITTEKRMFVLPKIELRQFDGQIENWIGFWGQFRKIHEDLTIDDDDKFQYLIRATEPGTPARDLVKSFPPSGPNYIKAIDQLKCRFAKDELIIQTYVRKLLHLVLQQAHTTEGPELRTLYDRLNTQLRALESLGVTTDKYAAMLYPLVESALPESVLRVWERSVKHPVTDMLTQLMSFLKLEVECEEKIHIAKNSFQTTKSREPTAACISSTKESKPIKKNFNTESKPTDKICIWCNKNTHYSTECIETKKMNLEQKKEFLKSKKACLICLRKGHFANNCRFFPKCLNCTKRHTYVMCPDIHGNNNGNVNKHLSYQPSTSTAHVMSNDQNKSMQEEKSFSHSDMNQNVLLCHRSSTTLLQTIAVNLVFNNKIVKVRALLDSGAQRSYITKDVIKSLGINSTKSESLFHCLFGGVETTLSKHYVYKICMQDLLGKFECIISVLDKDKICNSLPKLNDFSIFSKLAKLNINLPDDENCSEIGLLIGADYSGLLYTGDIVQVNESLVAMRTKLGWVLQGRTTNLCASTFCQTISCFHIAALWDLETIGIKDPAEKKKNEVVEKEIMSFFLDTVKINSDGRYEVCLPWKEDANLLSNKEIALKRLNSTTKKLLVTGNFSEYDKSLKEWLDLGIIEQVEGDETGHYLPHHAVIKESSLTTRVRPVFDASARDANDRSVNNSLEPGINLLEVIPKLLMDFRKRAIGVTADIKKAFLQISLSTADRKYLQFLWWEDEHRKSLITYRHCRVVFGVTSSPFLLNATIRYHLESDKIPFHLKETANKLKQSFYVDNCLTSCSSVLDSENFIQQSKELMLMAKMELRGWVVGPSKEETIISTLGLMWNTKFDTLSINTKPLSYNSEKVTKRYILSMAHRVFDPVGYTCPVSLLPKILLKKLHNEKLDWDVEVPKNIYTTFLKWVGNLKFLENISIPRCLTVNKIEECNLTIHAFCDASREAYAAVLFLRSELGNKVCVQLLAAKSRISPNKEITDVSIPRLELLAAVLAVRLYTQSRDSLALKHACYFWSDSNVVLAWIMNNGDGSVFVKNRVKEIRSETKVHDWYHIPGSVNPADLPSRGCNADVLLDSGWWNGPDWLKLDMKEWPFTVMRPFCTKNEPIKEKTLLDTTNDHFTDRLLYFSKYTKLLRMTAWMLRFIYNSRLKPAVRKYGNLCVEEVVKAELTIFKLIQKEYFTDTKSYKDLNTLKDVNGLIRVKTKLFSEEIPDGYKYPILLPSKHLIVERLVIEKHIKLFHAGTQTLMANLRETLWIVGVRLLVKRVSKKCVVCQKHRATCFRSQSAPLPIKRTDSNSKPFETTGIDLAGPFKLRSNTKVSIVLFTCAVLRAVHLELVDSLSTNAFLISFRRFIARRGRVRDAYSDNGTNFVGAKNLFKTIDWNAVQEHASIQKICWHLIAPSSPWWGGWWERMVRTVKELLRRVLGRASLTLLEFETILAECESIINSRPLTYISDDADVLIQPLTPAMFLQPIPCSDVSDLDLLDAQSLNVRTRYLQKLRDDLRSLFTKEYLSLLVHRGRGHVLKDPKVGDVVLIETPEKRVLWPLGVITDLYKGIDGVYRTAKIKTSKGVYTRSTKCLYPLELT